MLTIRDEAFAELGDTNLADLRRRAEPRSLQITDIDRTTRRRTPSRSTAAATSRSIASAAASSCPATSMPRLPARLRVQHSAPTACRSGSPATTALAQRRLRHPARRPPAAPARARRSTATACSAARARSTGRATSAPWRTSTASCSAPPTGPACRRPTCRTSLALLQDLSRFPTLADRGQQGFVNFLYLGRLMSTRKASLERWRSRRVDARVIEPVAPLLRRQHPGRDHRRRADRARARLHARGARRAGHELLDAAAPLASTSTRTRTEHRGLGDTRRPDAYPNELERPLVLSLIQLLWDRGEANGYAHHMTAIRCRTPPPTRCSARGVRRPPGGERHDRGRGAHDRRVGPLAGARARPAHRREPVLRDPADEHLSRSTARRSSSGTRGIPAPPTTNTPRARARTRTAHRGTARRRGAEVRVPEAATAR